MGEGDLKELRELVEFLRASGISEFDMERPELKVRLKFAATAAENASAAAGGIDLASLARLMASSAGAPTQMAVAPAEGTGSAAGSAPAPAASAPPEPTDEDAGMHIVKSPLVGTYYDAPSPDADPFIKLGDTVSTGAVLCIVEAMKIMNEIESDASGEIAKIYVRPGQPVEYGQRLFAIRA